MATNVDEDLVDAAQELTNAGRMAAMGVPWPPEPEWKVNTSSSPTNCSTLAAAAAALNAAEPPPEGPPPTGLCLERLIAALMARQVWVRRATAHPHRNAPSRVASTLRGW